MKFKLYKNFGALNSPPIFDAFASGVKTLGHTIVENDEDVAVIWSVLWHGRMASNQQIYNHCVKNNKPVIIIEVGNLKRGTTWRICQDHINGLGIFGNIENLDPLRPQKLGVALKSPKLNRRGEILIATQHAKSLQWKGQPSMEQWVKDTIEQIKKHSGRKIVVRPHPRSILREKFVNAVIELPTKIVNSYDDFDINYDYHCVINHNSGPAVQAAINGTPTICDPTSLAFPVSEKWENLENPQLPDREEWFLKLCHAEWTIDEIRQGIPLKRLEHSIESRLKKIS
jgi:hypothetical protein